jgi:hypothetical protein
MCLHGSAHIILAPHSLLAHMHSLRCIYTCVCACVYTQKSLTNLEVSEIWPWWNNFPQPDPQAETARSRLLASFPEKHYKCCLLLRLLRYRPLCPWWPIKQALPLWESWQPGIQKTLPSLFRVPKVPQDLGDQQPYSEELPPRTVVSDSSQAGKKTPKI